MASAKETRTRFIQGQLPGNALWQREKVQTKTREEIGYSCCLTHTEKLREVVMLGASRKYKRISGKKKGFILTFRMFQHTSSEGQSKLLNNNRNLSV